jgi:hypothetical protein
MNLGGGRKAERGTHVHARMRGQGAPLGAAHCSRLLRVPSSTASDSTASLPLMS